MREVRTSLGLGGIGLLSLACCVGLPLVVAAGFSVAAFAWVGGIAIGAIALAGALTLLALQIQTRRSCKTSAPPTSTSPLARGLLAGNRTRDGERHTVRARTDPFGESLYRRSSTSP